MITTLSSPELSNPDHALRRQRLDHVIDRALKEHRIVGGVLLVARHGELVYRRAAGLANREARTPMREDTLFRLASVTKPIVAMAFMRLVEQGLASLRDPVARWLPYFTPSLPDGRAPVITLHHLLSHTSGLGYGFQEGFDSVYRQLGISDGLDISDLTLEENLRRLAKAPLYFEPGTAWRYSLSMDVIGAVIEKITEKSLPDAISEIITKPLGMQNTRFVIDAGKNPATPYANATPEPVRIADGMEVPLPEALGGHCVRFAPSRAFDASAFPSGGTGMIGSADDVLRLIEVIRNQGAPVLSHTSLAQMTSPQVEQTESLQPGWGFGYGWAVIADPALSKTPQGKGTLQWGGVYGHCWFVDPMLGYSVALLTNTAYEGMIGPLTLQVRDAIYGS
jgi:CubicO group peptidase (beta-lactamase class C family)